MRHLAMTGMETSAIISRIFLGEAIRATPPSARICAGTRSRAITATAPDRSAISACLAVVTSMITPPLSISARPVFRRRLVLVCPLFCDIGLPSSRASFYSSFAIRGIWFCSYGGCVVAGLGPAGTGLSPVTTRASALGKSAEHALGIDRDEQALAAREHFPFFVENLGHVDVLAALQLDLARFHSQWLLQRHRLQILHGHLGGHRHHVAQFIHFAHGFIEDGRDDAAVAVSGRSGETFAQAEAAHEAVA